MPKIEEQYADVLQNIESGIVATYREHPEMSDFEVMRVLDALVDGYRGEAIGRTFDDSMLPDLDRLCCDAVRRMCEWRLGRAGPVGGPPSAADKNMEHVTVDEIVLCLKKILKSAKWWNKEGGRQGYLNFVIQYVK